VSAQSGPGGPAELDELELFLEYRKTLGRETRNRLVEAHRGLAVSLARRFEGRGEPLDDLVQVAMLGVLKAVERFDPDRGLAFTTFATPTVLGELKRHFRDHTWAVKVPRPAKELHLRLGATTATLHQRLGRAPTVDELAAALETSVDAVLEAMEAGGAYRTSSLTTPADPEGEALADRLGDPENGYSSVDARVTLQRLMDGLPERLRDIVYLRYFEELTQSEIAERVGISQMHVSRLLRQALERLGDSVQGR
jgi:RNA polymerase sigma-B factor